MEGEPRPSAVPGDLIDEAAVATPASRRAARYELRPGDAPSARELGTALGLSPTVAQVLLHRGVSTVDAAREYLEPKLAGLTAPDAMIDRGLAADRLVRALRARERIAVFGDYDVDGTTSTAILCGILEALGGDVVALVANRFAGGYGFSGPALERVKETGATLLVTCDCGSSDHERIASARAAGIDVIVVDHHLVPKEPLPALAFLNPHRPDCGFPYKGLCSAGLALSIGAAVRTLSGAKLDVRPFLDLVALGTIADVAPLDGDNRRLVRAGLARLAGHEGRPGVLALRDAARVRPGAFLGGGDVSFRLAPRINAAGRLGDAALALALLRARDHDTARELATRLEAVNQERRAIQQRIAEEAILQAREVYGERRDGGFVVAGEGWHRGVVGIVAAKLVDVFDVPVLAIALENGHGHGSGRTPPGFHVYDALSACRDVLDGFGGHRAAVGLSVQASRIDALRARFDDACRGLRKERGEPDIRRHMDVRIDGASFPVPRASELALLEPVGEANAEPRVLVESARVEDANVVGQGHLKLILRVGNDRLPAFGFDLGHEIDRLGREVSVVGALRPDDWRGGEAVELRLEAVLR